MKVPMFEIRHYITENGRDTFMQWYASIKERKFRIAIDRRLYRAELGHFGDHRYCRDGVWELRIDKGPGYRVYYALAGKMLILLLNAGDKHSQRSDIDMACRHWRIWQHFNP